MHDRLGIGELGCAQPEAFGGSQIVQFGQVEVFVSGPVGNGQDELGSRPAAGAAQHTGQQQSQGDREAAPLPRRRRAWSGGQTATAGPSPQHHDRGFKTNLNRR